MKQLIDSYSDSILENYRLILQQGLELDKVWFWMFIIGLAIVWLLFNSITSNIQITKLEKRLEYLEGVNEDNDDLRKSSLEEVKNNLHQVNANQKALEEDAK